MSDEGDTDAGSGEGGAAATVGLPLNAAGGQPPGIADDARAFLRKQSRYLEPQMEDLHEQRDLTLSHLKWRRFNDWMRGA